MKNIAVITNSPRLFNEAVAWRVIDGWDVKTTDRRIVEMTKGRERIKIWRVQSINDVRGVLFSNIEVRIDPQCFHLENLAEIELYLESHKQEPTNN
jgi:hypothetical protein